MVSGTMASAVRRRRGPEHIDETDAFGASLSAEAVGFEPTVRGYRTTVFKTVSFGRSDTLPLVQRRS